MTLYLRTLASNVAAATSTQIDVAAAASLQGTTTQNVTVAGSPATGDRLIFICSANSVQGAASVTWTDPTGATLVDTLEPPTGAYPRIRVWEKEHDGTSSYTFGCSASGQCCTIMTLDDTGGVVSVSTYATGNSSTTEPNSPSLGVGDKSVVLTVCAGILTLGGMTAPTNYTEDVDETASGNRGMSVASRTITTGTTEDPGDFTSTSNTTWTAMTIGIEPTDVS